LTSPSIIVALYLSGAQAEPDMAVDHRFRLTNCDPFEVAQ